MLLEGGVGWWTEDDRSSGKREAVGLKARVETKDIRNEDAGALEGHWRQKLGIFGRSHNR